MVTDPNVANMCGMYLFMFVGLFVLAVLFINRGSGG